MVNYDDKRLANVESDKQQAISEMEKTYDKMVGDSDSYYQNQIGAVKDYADKQTQIQQAQTDFAIEQIEQQKQQANKDYLKEQSGAYVDWQKESNKYGANAEQMAASGLENTGYSESSQVSMFNTYQNRVATARESFNQAVLNYNNAIKDAQLQNNSALAEIAFNALQQELELSLAGFQYKNQLLLDKANKKTEIDNTYYGRWQDVLNQINTENSLSEQMRQYNESLAEEKRQYNESLALQQQQIAQEQAQWEKEYQFQQQQLAEEQRQYNASLAAENSSSTRISSSKSSSSGDYAVNTPYYQGDLNPDANEFGTFKNGYQPKGISGHGKLTKTGDYIDVDTETLSGHRTTVHQNQWKAEDGTLWYWEGRQNKYIQIK